MRGHFSAVFVATIATLFTTSSVGATSLHMNTDAAVYNVGQTITLTLTGDTTGGAAAASVFVEIVYDDPSLVDGLGAVASQSAAITYGGGFINWVLANPACQVDRCTVFDQSIAPLELVPDPAIIIGTLTIPTVDAGVLTLSPGTVDFFGAAPPSPVTVTIVPEPASGGLVALGLFVLAAARRRSSAGRP